MPVNITGWVLKSVDQHGEEGLEIKIPKASALFKDQEGFNKLSDVFLSPGETAFLITGASPVNESFRLNKCFGYLSQSSDFNPGIRNECPRAEDEDWPSFVYKDQECFNYIKRISRCRAPTSFPSGLRDKCVEKISEQLNYNSCLENHLRDDDFYKPEWRVYFNLIDELWPEKGKVILYDRNGNLIDELDY
jgi:hypothetical protein